MSKELYMAAHEELVDEEMERTGCDWQTAYERTADRAYALMTDRIADWSDSLRDRAKYGE